MLELISICKLRPEGSARGRRSKWEHYACKWLIISQRDHWIDLHSSSCGQITRDGCHECECAPCQSQRQWIGRRQAEELASDQPSSRDRQRYAIQLLLKHPPHPFVQLHPENAAGLGSQRLWFPDFVGAAADRESHYPI